jgi:hypothetical protein
MPNTVGCSTESSSDSGQDGSCGNELAGKVATGSVERPGRRDAHNASREIQFFGTVLSVFIRDIRGSRSPVFKPRISRMNTDGSTPQQRDAARLTSPHEVRSVQRREELTRSHEGVVGSFLEKARVKLALRLRASAGSSFRIQLDTEAIESFSREDAGNAGEGWQGFHASAQSSQRSGLSSLGRSGAAVVRECCAFPPSLLLHPPVTQHPARHAHRRTPQPS